MAFLGETPEASSQGLHLFLLIAFQILGVAQPYVCALEIASIDLLKILPTIDRVSGQVIEPSFGHVGLVSEEELNDKQIAIHPNCPTCEVVVL
jgi:hypothetical protein